MPDAVPLDLVGSGLILLTGLLHTRGVAPGALVQNAVVALKILALLALIALGAVRLSPQPVPEPSPFSFATFAVTMMWVSLSYSGWNAAVYVGGEARDPKRSLSRSMLLATLLVTALYLALNWIFVSAAPIDQLAGQEDVAALAARALGGSSLELFVRAILVVALVTSISSMVMIGPRVIARMAEDGLLARRLSFHGEVPAAAIWTQALLAVAILWASGLREQLTNLGWVLSLFTALTVIGLLRIRWREGPERVRIPGYPVVPLAFLVIVSGLTGTMALVNGRQLLPAVVVLLSGACLYAVRSPSRG